MNDVVEELPADGISSDNAQRARALIDRHLRLGWWGLLVFVTLGLVLETMHGFKVDWYLNVGNETRRLMWTLAHTHGTLLSLVQIAFALTVGYLGERASRQVGQWHMASAMFTAALLLMPTGFFLGGIVIYEGDPGLGILLVPLGGLALAIGILITAWQFTAR